MIEKKLKEILLDVPKMMREGRFTTEEQELLMYPNLYHYQAFSPFLKYYLMLRYGKQIESLERIVRKFAISSFLEVGSGTGGTCIYIALRNELEECIGIDIKELSIGIARKRIEWHAVDTCKMIYNDFLNYKSSRKFDFIYSQAAFELIKPVDKALKKLKELINPNGVVVLDMANPFFRNYNRKYLTEEDFYTVKDFFYENDFEISIEYLDIFTSLDFTNLLKKNSRINKTVRLIAIANS